jgi:hypothetical protein
MKRNLGIKNNNLQALLEYRLEYKEEQKRIDKQVKRDMENSLLFMGR